MPDGGASTAQRHRLSIRQHGSDHLTSVTMVGHLDPAAQQKLAQVLIDPLLEQGFWELAVQADQLDIGLAPGVTDGVADQVIHAARLLQIDITDVAIGRTVSLPRGATDQTIRRDLANSVIERWSVGQSVEPGFTGRSATVEATNTVALPGSDEALRALSVERGLALDLQEMWVIRDHFALIGRDPTDAELETLAQTWSEHCAHKSFRAEISFDDGTRGSSLLGQLRACTTRINAPFVVSAFDGNAGIVQFDPHYTYALKCETHNHPSAIEPFGGANTGVGGVIRDILGAAHRPIACTDILCFGPDNLPLGDLPVGVLHPRRIREGVVAGVADYGNKIGLPTVAGSVLYDPAYTSNPLVFCGCIGIAPANRAPLTGPHPGDRVIVFGGRTGRDGIRGATFSSMEMDATTGDVAGASVQIGDPITEKLVSDLLNEAWGLFTAITDCGAGGLSSAIGELADGVGADVELGLVPLKYSGLAPWEIWLSEAQERMVVAADPSTLRALMNLAQRHGVEMVDVGEFTGDHHLTVRYNNEPIVDLTTEFLHNGRPKRELQAVRPRPSRADTAPACPDARAAILALLGHPNIASKASIIRRYDHEILGSTVVRPLTGANDDGPADGIVLCQSTESSGIVIGLGVNPWFGNLDPERMAHAVVDEAIRNCVVAGGDPTAVALMDNFSWGNPTRPSTYGELVAAVQGCCDAAEAHRAPFVSGKDSLNNEYLAADGTRHAIPPTLVITAVAPLRDISHATTPDAKQPGNVLIIVGRTLAEFGGSHLSIVLNDGEARSVPSIDPDAPQRYRAMHAAIAANLIVSAHDCSEGGVAVAIAEMAIAGRLGLTIDTTAVHPDPTTALFSESTGRIICEVRPENLAEVQALLPQAWVLGEINDTNLVQFGMTVTVTVEELNSAWQGPQ